MVLRFRGWLVLVVMATPALGQSALSTAPRAVQDYYGEMINAADLRLRYCTPDRRTCILIESPCIGQCCDQHLADDYGFDRQWTGAWRIPEGYVYAGWECRPLGKTSEGLELSGDAGRRR